MRRASDLLNLPVVTEAGERLGHAFDLRAERRGDEVRVVGVVVGRHGLYERLGIGGSKGEAKRGHKVWDRDVVPWEAVVRLERKRIVVRDGTRPTS